MSSGHRPARPLQPEATAAANAAIARQFPELLADPSLGLPQPDMAVVEAVWNVAYAAAGGAMECGPSEPPAAVTVIEHPTTSTERPETPARTCGTLGCRVLQVTARCSHGREARRAALTALSGREGALLAKHMEAIRNAAMAEHTQREASLCVAERKESATHVQRLGQAWVLEIVSGMVDDWVTLEATSKDLCSGKHPEWHKIARVMKVSAGAKGPAITTPGGATTIEVWSETLGSGARVTDSCQSLTFPVLSWLGDVSPNIYRFCALSCQGQSEVVEVRSYPKDELRVTIRPRKFLGPVEEALQKAADVLSGRKWGKDPPFEFADGEVRINAAWQEKSKDYRAFYKYSIEAAFEPLLGIGVRWTWPVPQVPVPIELGAGVFCEVRGRLAGSFGFEATGPDDGDWRCYGKGTGTVRGGVGAYVFLASEKILSVEIGGYSELKGEIKAYWKQGPTISMQLTWEPLKVMVLTKVCFGWVDLRFTWHVFDTMKFPKGDPWELPLKRLVAGKQADASS